MGACGSHWDRIVPGVTFEAARVGLCLTDADGLILAANPEACRLFGLAQAEVLGRRFLAFVPKGQREAATAAYRRVLQGAAMEQPDWHVRLRGGENLWVRISPSLTRTIDGSAAVLCVLTDITPSLQAEEARRRAEFRERGFLQSNVIGVFEADDTGRILEANEAFLRLVGHDRKSLIERGLTWQDLTPPEYGPVDRAASEAILATGTCAPYAKEYFHRDGSRVAALVTAARIEGEPPTFMSYVLDRGERKAVEVALREGQETLRKILDSALSAVITIDASGIVTDWRGSSEAIFGWSADEAVGRPLADLIVPPRYHEAHHAGMERYLRTSEAHVLNQRLELEAVRKDGTEIPVELIIAAITSAGRPLFCAFLRNLTEQRQAEEQIKRAHAELEQRVRERTAELEAANAELESFSYSVSHDLRQPLRGIDGFIRMTLHDYGDDLNEEGHAFLRRALAACGRMAGLIDDLLGFSRLARAELLRERIDVTALAWDVGAEVAARHTGQQVDFRVEESLTAHADRGLLRAVLANLLENAWKYSAKKPTPSVSVGRCGDAFFVSDNGVGFDPQYAHKLFTPFERLHSESDYPGMGIGLATVRRIVERHGGRVWAEAVPGEGAAFYFTLP